MTVVLRIYTGNDCGADDTLVLYRRATRQRIGWVTAETGYTRRPFVRRSGRRRRGPLRSAARGNRLDRLGLFSFTPSGLSYRFHRPWRTPRKSWPKVLSEAQEYSTRILLDKDTVQFRYESGYPSIGKADRQSEQRYLVQGSHALRMAPLGPSLYEFIWEWLRLDDADAARFSTPAAAAQHHGSHERRRRRCRRSL